MSINNIISELAPSLVTFRHALHRRPELGGKEYETTSSLRKKLEEAGIEILDIGMETGLLALVRGAKPGGTIAIRADIDALPLTENTGLDFSSEIPGVMHACGHDFHTAIVLGAGLALQKVSEELCGNVLLIFQPGEEILLGARLIADSGILQKLGVQSVFGIHCTPGFETGTAGIRRGQFMASSSKINITVRGTGVHGAHPQMGVDPVLIAAHIITALQALVSRETSPLDTLVISIGKIRAGEAFNIIPDTVELEGTVRTLSDEIQGYIGEKIERLADGVARAFRGSAQCVFERGTIPLICDGAVVDVLEESLKNTIGAKNIHYIQEATTGSEDFSEYGRCAPIAYCRIGARGRDPRSHHPLHSPLIALDDGAVEVGMRIVTGYCLTALGRQEQ